MDMELSEYLKKKNKTVKEFAEEVGVSHVAVHLWLNGEIPSPVNACSVVKLTKGWVKLEDLYGSLLTEK